MRTTLDRTARKSPALGGLLGALLGAGLAALAASTAGGARPSVAQPRPARPAPSAPSARADTLWLFAADPARDAVHLADTEASLVKRYGRANVTRDSVPGAEGESFPGTVLFARDSTRTLYVYWEDGKLYKRPESVRTGYDAVAWTVWPGVRVGTRIADVERVNGRPFKLSGFGFDYGGSVTDWRGGRLGTVWEGGRAGPAVTISFLPGPDRPTDRVSGESDFSSALPAMRAADPRIGFVVGDVR